MTKTGLAQARGVTLEIVVRGFVVVGFLAVAYLATFVLLHPRIGDPIVALSTIPMVAAAWMWGLRGGAIAGIAVVATNIALMQTIGDHDGFRVMQLPRIAVALGIAIAAGWARDITRRQKQLLAEIETTATALQASKDNLELLVAVRTSELERVNQSLLDENAARREAETTIRRDLEARRQLEARVAAADRMAVVGTLTAGIGHEINNPLAVILANLTYVADNLPSVDAQVAEAMRDALLAARRASDIVANMRVFVQSNSQLDVADVHRVVTSTVQMIQNELRHRARLEIDVVDLPKVRISESQLGQILLNLLTNAAHALGDRADNVVRIEARYVDNRVRLRVSDTGNGIPVEAQAHIFEPFFTTKPVGVGTGLGLWVCHHIITVAGGEIVVESSSEAGSTFRVDLPVARLSEELLPSLPTPIGKQRGRVLVIDDDHALRRAIGRYIKRQHDLVVVESAMAGYDLLVSGERFDVILCDMMMPDMDGAELFERLEAVLPDQAARVVFMTGGAFTQRTKDFLSPTRHRLLEKPFEATALEAMIQEVMATAA